MIKILSAIGGACWRLVERLVIREPVMFFGAVGLWIVAGTDVVADSPAGVALAATVLLFQRAFSDSKASAEEKVTKARKASQDETVAYLASLPAKAAARTTKKAAARGGDKGAIDVELLLTAVVFFALGVICVKTGLIG